MTLLIRIPETIQFPKIWKDFTENQNPYEMCGILSASHLLSRQNERSRKILYHFMIFAIVNEIIKIAKYWFSIIFYLNTIDYTFNISLTIAKIAKWYRTFRFSSVRSIFLGWCRNLRTSYIQKTPWRHSEDIPRIKYAMWKEEERLDVFFY